MKRVLLLLVVLLAAIPAMAQNDYYRKKAESYTSEAEYYQKKADALQHY